MYALLIAVGVVMVLATLVLIYKIFTLVDIARGSDKKRVGLSNQVNAFLFPVFFIALMGGILYYSPIAAENFLPNASEHGARTDYWFWFSIVVIFIPFVITHVLLFFGSFFYQYSDNRKASFYPHNDKLEIIWTVVPALVMATLVFTGWDVWTDITAPAPEDSVEVEIVGKQFNWMMRYGGLDNKVGKADYTQIDDMNALGIDLRDAANMDDIVQNKIVVPVGQNVLLKIRSRDVLHSVFLPHFRVKMDAVPGMPTQFWFKPTITTAEMRAQTDNPDFEYEMACTQICGSGHFAMRMIVEVVSPQEYQDYIASQEPWMQRNADYIKEKLGENVPAHLQPMLAENTDK